jgi:hypothetical protein
MPKQTRAPNAALLAEMTADTPAASPDQLENIRRLAAEMRDLQTHNASMQEQIKQNNERIEKIKWQDLLDAMDRARMRSFVLEAEGNFPAYEIKTGAYYHANISSDWPEEQRAKSFAWLGKHEPGMLRNTISVEFGKNTAKQQKMLAAFCKKNKMNFQQIFGVPWNTLTAYVKEQIEEHKATPPLELLGAKVGRVANMKPVKEKN